MEIIFVFIHYFIRLLCLVQYLMKKLNIFEQGISNLYVSMYVNKIKCKKRSI